MIAKNSFGQTKVDRDKALHSFEEKRAKMEIINHYRKLIIEKGVTEGIMKCPFCDTRMNYEYSPATDRINMKCETDNCIEINELGD